MTFRQLYGGSRSAKLNSYSYVVRNVAHRLSILRTINRRPLLAAQALNDDVDGQLTD